MYSFRYGGKNGKRYSLATSNDQVVVRTNSRSALAGDRPFEVSALSNAARDVLDKFELTTRFREAGVEILRAKVTRGSKSLRDKARAILKKEPEIEFAGRVLVTPNERPVLYTENFFVKFDSDQSSAACRKILKKYNLAVKNELEYARNAYFVAAPDDTGLVVFDIAEKLIQEPSVDLCHPELLRESRQRSAFPQQWHLKKATINGTVVDQHANVEAAWL